jgi:hypothetical protein
MDKYIRYVYFTSSQIRFSGNFFSFLRKEQKKMFRRGIFDDSSNEVLAAFNGYISTTLNLF